MTPTQYAASHALKLHEVIAANDSAGDAVEVQTLKRYKRSLLTWYTAQGMRQPALMVTSIFNACQYAKIVDGQELEEAITAYMDANEIPAEDREAERENILFNSITYQQL